MKQYCDHAPTCHDSGFGYLVDGFFYTAAKNNSFAEGTASAGLLQYRMLCINCLTEYIEAGRHPKYKTIEEAKKSLGIE
jgi:hypothetical protein